ncbi:MAG: CPBP family intramembrane metalloprotease [Elusimicrobia bacterium]|nr:CPBP family intramembrane metalloprotease [Elusimicrobiota bacterium]
MLRLALALALVVPRGLVFAQTVQLPRAAVPGAASGVAGAAARGAGSLVAPGAGPSFSPGAAPLRVGVTVAVAPLRAAGATAPSAPVTGLGRASAATGLAGAEARPRSPATGFRENPSAAPEVGPHQIVAAHTEALRPVVAWPGAASTFGELGAVFDKSGRFGPTALEVRGTGAPERSELAPSRGEDASRAPEPPAPQAPRSSLSRTFKIGYVAGWLGMAFNFGFPVIASALGFGQDATYQPPPLPSETLAGGAALALFLWFQAPVAEEALFRGTIMSVTKRAFGKLGELGRFWLPAALSAAVFVYQHERVDPVTMAVYAGLSLVLSRVYYKEGVLAAMAAHATYNVLLGSLMLAELFGLALAVPAALLIFVGFPAVIWAAQSLWRDRADRRAGRIVPYAMSPGLARRLSLALIAGTIVVGLLGSWMMALGGGAYWIPGALMLYLMSRGLIAAK